MEEVAEDEVRVKEPRVAGLLHPEVQFRVLSRRYMGDQITCVYRRLADFSWLHSSLATEHGDVSSLPKVDLMTSFD